MKDRSLDSFKNIIFFILLGIITVFFAYILKPFFFAIFWAVLIASIFAPLYKLLNKKFKSPNLCASITLVIILLCLILPIGLIIDLLIVEAFDIYKSFDSNTGSWMGTFTEMLNSLNKNPLFARLNIDQAFLLEKSQDALKAVTTHIFQHISEYTQNTIFLIVNFAVMLYTLFYFLRDGVHLITSFNRYIPVENRHLNTFINQFLTTAKASLKFTFIIGGIQGFLGGMIFYITGIERALVWGVLMLGFSIVPAIGCSLIWAPAGIIMLFLGYTWQGITILVFGSIVISSVDNLLRPVLLGHDTQMHSLLIFLSTLGGILAFGFSGFVLGPVIASLFLASWRLFLELYQEETK
ncbi:MAG: AI-2E family transporter [Deltaproteobacteria bacterium]|nr:AI-2E family transporter [Deltaproteobacteria bacterium]